MARTWCLKPWIYRRAARTLQHQVGQRTWKLEYIWRPEDSSWPTWYPDTKKTIHRLRATTCYITSAVCNSKIRSFDHHVTCTPWCYKIMLMVFISFQQSPPPPWSLGQISLSLTTILKFSSLMQQMKGQHSSAGWKTLYGSLTIWG